MSNLSKYDKIIIGSLATAWMLVAGIYFLGPRAFGVAPDRRAPASPAPVGRYLLVESHYSHTSEFTRDGRELVDHAQELFKIDTATGQVWMLLSSAIDGKDDSTWLPVPEKYGAPPMADPKK